MEYIQKLPFIFGALMALIIGIISYRDGVPRQTVYIRMAEGLVVFFILGILVRNTLEGIIEEINLKKLKDLAEQPSGNEDSGERPGMAEVGREGEGNTIDHKVGDSLETDDFQPLILDRISKKT
ncbi:MAG: hypothetical protein QHH06_00885 [Clostridiales bacterium]|jgi:hypothetical protein|nr:hypothetical protein [Eubacteriales bacterium]MDH7565026.1 hypothetical protein [Clostridiales bacterium]